MEECGEWEGGGGQRGMWGVGRGGGESGSGWMVGQESSCMAYHQRTGRGGTNEEEGVEWWNGRIKYSVWYRHIVKGLVGVGRVRKRGWRGGMEGQESCVLCIVCQVKKGRDRKDYEGGGERRGVNCSTRHIWKGEGNVLQLTMIAGR